MDWTRGKLLGRGAFGEVFLAVPEDPNFPDFAVKSAPEEKAKSLLVEHQILEQFRGVPGIVQCLGGGLSEEGDDGRRTYDLLLEYAPEGSLSDLITEYGGGEGTGIPESHVRAYTRMILQALYTIHSSGFTHCDVKPRNILVFPAGNRGHGIRKLKLADFGSALETWKLIPGRKHYRGTRRYLPPEVALSGTVTPAMDIWALGCTVVQMLTGERPWVWVEDDKNVLTAIKKGCQPYIPDWLSKEGKDFLQKCFAPNAIDRLDTGSFLKHPFVARNGRNTLSTKKTTVVGQMEQQKQIPVRFPLLPHEFFQHSKPALLV